MNVDVIIVDRIRSLSESDAIVKELLSVTRRCNSITAYTLLNESKLAFLRQSPDFAYLLCLLEYIAHGNYKGFHDSELFKIHKDVDYIYNLKLSSLVSYATHNKVFSLTDVSEVFDLLDDNDAGALVVDAIGRNLIRGTIDEVDRLVRVTSTCGEIITDRTICMLYSQLTAWNNSLNSEISSLTRSRIDMNKR